MKGAQAFRTISEAADEIGVAQHVLRFWETKFSFIRPMKRAGGRRFYRPSDIALLATVRRLLHNDGYTIKSVQNLHRNRGLQGLVASAASSAPDNRSEGRAFTIESPKRAAAGALEGLSDALNQLASAKSRLDAVLAHH